MARKAEGAEILERAQEMMPRARDANELRRLQAVVFPLAFGMSTKDTAAAIGRGTTWTSRARSAFIESGGEAGEGPARTRNRALLAEGEEAAFLEPFIEAVRRGGALVVGAIHAALEARLGRRVAKATTYNLLHRHGWRRPAPDRRRVPADPAVQGDLEKNSARGPGGSKKGGRGLAR